MGWVTLKENLSRVSVGESAATALSHLGRITLCAPALLRGVGRQRVLGYETSRGIGREANIWIMARLDEKNCMTDGPNKYRTPMALAWRSRVKSRNSRTVTTRWAAPAASMLRRLPHCWPGRSTSSRRITSSVSPRDCICRTAF